MLGDLMGNMEEQQAKMKEKLAAVSISENLEGITIEGNATGEILNINLDTKYSDPNRKEELEDLLIVAINNFLNKVSEEEAEASQNMINDLLPGMGGMFGM